MKNTIHIAHYQIELGDEHLKITKDIKEVSKGAPLMILVVISLTLLFSPAGLVSLDGHVLPWSVVMIAISGAVTSLFFILYQRTHVTEYLFKKEVLQVLENKKGRVTSQKQYGYSPPVAIQLKKYITTTSAGPRGQGTAGVNSSYSISLKLQAGGEIDFSLYTRKDLNRFLAILKKRKLILLPDKITIWNNIRKKEEHFLLS